MNISKLCFRSSKMMYRNHVECLVKRQVSAGNTVAESERNPAPVFFSPEVQSLLKRLTSMDLQRVFQQRKDQQRLQTPTYQFMTTEEVEISMSEAKQRAEERLQMPPVLLPRVLLDSIMAKDPVLQGYDESKHIFTDITYGILNRERLIVVRDPNGTLRKASWEEKDRINQIYFPTRGSKSNIPKMFDAEYLESLLNRGEYRFILDRACLQFEPDEPLYISVTQKVYEHLDEQRSFESLRSTRHFGPLAFHLAWNKKVDNLVLECIQNDRIEDAVSAIQLLYLVHPSLQSAKTPLDPTNPLDFIKKFVSEESSRRSSLELALQSYEEMSKQRQDLQASLEKAHGH